MIKTKINVIDLEATCESTKTPNFISEIIEIGIVTIDLKELTLENKKGIIVKPRQSKISEFCTQLTSITQEQVDTEGISLSAAFDILRHEYKSSKYPVAAYGLYDRKMLQIDAQRKQLDYPFNYNYYNVKNLIATLYGFNKELGLAKCLNHFNMPFEGNHHRGEDDAWNTAKLLLDKVLKPFYANSNI